MPGALPLGILLLTGTWRGGYLVPMNRGSAHRPCERLTFSEAYGQWRSADGDSVREGVAPLSEHVLQCIWYDRLFDEEGLTSDDGRMLRILSPGWWNRTEGPDFRNAQFELGETLLTGDVEIHLDHRGWQQHGHHLDARYDQVVLCVALEPPPDGFVCATSDGRAVPRLSLGNRLYGHAADLPREAAPPSVPGDGPGQSSQCQVARQIQGEEHLDRLLTLAGEWRMLAKARALRERADRAGLDQALYESFMAACGFSRFKHHFRCIAQQLPYERARQLAQADPLVLEAAFLQLAGLLPDALPDGTTAVPHFARLRSLRRDRLAGLKKLPLIWKRTGVRPANNPERRLAGAAAFIARTAAKGMAATLEELWREDQRAVARRRGFEQLFPGRLGFWATHCTWTGKRMATPSSPLGVQRVRAIIGNVFIPAALAHARRVKDRKLEESVFTFFAAFPGEAENHILTRMAPRLFGEGAKPRLDFRRQQGMLQLYQDWCEDNPSCRNCNVSRFLGA